eukprot:m.239961 g.239961  ORF g.239961 m.239961 type:complete len:694 (+) comp22943_c0_seq1:21-2102(+)
MTLTTLWLVFGAIGAIAASIPVASETNIDNICVHNASLAEQIIAAVNLTFPGLEQVAAAVRAKNLGLACEILAQYYQNCSSGSWLRVPAVPPSGKHAGGQADAALQDIFTLSGVGETAKIPRNADGGLDWHYTGPRHDIEFMNCLNRHQVFDVLLDAHQSTGNAVYAEKFGDLVVDWVSHLPCNPCTTGTMESPWRILEVGIRTVDPWPRAFYGFQHAPEFNTTARVLMLLGVHEHGLALVKYGNQGAPNWRMQQYAGLATIALAFPELSGAAAWLDQSLAGMQREIEGEVYADGVETEQTAGYDLMSANNFYAVLFTLTQAGREAPPAYARAVETMFNYIALSIDQTGFLPRNGDTDHTAPWRSSAMQEIARHFNRSDWQYIYSAGAQGTKPSGSASHLFEWAGQFVMKSGYILDDHWACFDVGPYGSSGHAHRDKLHLNIRAYSSMLLVDSGRFTYQGDGSIYHSQYATFTRAHNTFTIDGCDQSAAPAVAVKPVSNSTWTITEDHDYARGTMASYDGLKGNASHTRAVLYIKGQYWVVVDVIATDRPRSVQATWHAHPNSTVTLDPHAFSATVTGVPRGCIAVVPAADGASWGNATVVSGQQPPEFAKFQGWYSESYLDHRPAPTLVYNAAIRGSAVFAWLLYPSPTAPAALPSLAIAIKDARTPQQSVTVGVTVGTASHTHTLVTTPVL